MNENTITNEKNGIIFNQSAGSFRRLNRDPKEWIGEIAENNSITGVEFDVESFTCSGNKRNNKVFR